MARGRCVSESKSFIPSTNLFVRPYVSLTPMCRKTMAPDAVVPCSDPPLRGLPLRPLYLALRGRLEGDASRGIASEVMLGGARGCPSYRARWPIATLLRLTRTTAPPAAGPSEGGEAEPGPALGLAEDLSCSIDLLSTRCSDNPSKLPEEAEKAKE